MSNALNSMRRRRMLFNLETRLYIPLFCFMTSNMSSLPTEIQCAEQLTGGFVRRQQHTNQTSESCSQSSDHNCPLAHVAVVGVLSPLQTSVNHFRTYQASKVVTTVVLEQWQPYKPGYTQFSSSLQDFITLGEVVCYGLVFNTGK